MNGKTVRVFKIPYCVISSQNCCETGAPPMYTSTSELYSLIACVISFMLSIVVVKRALKPTMHFPRFLTESKNFSGPASTPRSTISHPSPRIIIFTMFLPISCISPFTVPRIRVPLGFTCPDSKKGRRCSIAAFIAFAEISRLGTNTFPSENFSPILFIPSINATFNTSSGEMPCSSASFVSLRDAPFSPFNSSGYGEFISTFLFLCKGQFLIKYRSLVNPNLFI